MRSHRVVFVAAALLVLVGLLALDAARTPSSASVQGRETFRIPDGPGWYSFFELEMLAGGRVSVSFAESAGGAVAVYLLPQEAYGIYETTGLVPASATRISGSDALFEANIPQEGTYYLVFAHGQGYEALSQEVEVRYVFMGMVPTGPDQELAWRGFLAVIVGGVLANAGVLLRFRWLRREIGTAA